MNTASNEVHIHFARLDRGSAETARLERFLVPGERTRADRLLSRLLRDRFIAGRGFLRETLSGYLGVKPEDIFLAENEWGKPRLVETAGPKALFFNLSHAADLAVMAVSRISELGIDLERVEEGLPIRAMARIFFSPREQMDLLSLPAEEQPSAFFRCWTRKEAYLKGCGSGFTHSPRSFDVSLLPGHPPALHAHQAFPEDPAVWSLIDIPVPRGYWATLAFTGESPDIKLWGSG